MSGAKKKTWWVVMAVHSWDCLQACGVPLAAPPEGPQGFLPVFENRELATKWSNGRFPVLEVGLLHDS